MPKVKLFGCEENFPSRSAPAAAVARDGTTARCPRLVYDGLGAVAEVEVDRASGAIKVAKIFVTHDCGSRR
jgi:CO/xanthine dehydrogenase Mo-binding subunit